MFGMGAIVQRLGQMLIGWGGPPDPRVFWSAWFMQPASSAPMINAGASSASEQLAPTVT
jgi:hypothetical protein